MTKKKKIIMFIISAIVSISMFSIGMLTMHMIYKINSTNTQITTSYKANKLQFIFMENNNSETYEYSLENYNILVECNNSYEYVLDSIYIKLNSINSVSKIRIKVIFDNNKIIDPIFIPLINANNSINTQEFTIEKFKINFSNLTNNQLLDKYIVNCSGEIYWK